MVQASCPKVAAEEVVLRIKQQFASLDQHVPALVFFSGSGPNWQNQPLGSFLEAAFAREGLESGGDPSATLSSAPVLLGSRPLVMGVASGSSSHLGIIGEGFECQDGAPALSALAVALPSGSPTRFATFGDSAGSSASSSSSASFSSDPLGALRAVAWRSGGGGSSKSKSRSSNIGSGSSSSSSTGAWASWERLAARAPGRSPDVLLWGTGADPESGRANVGPLLRSLGVLLPPGTVVVREMTRVDCAPREMAARTSSKPCLAVLRGGVL